MARVAITPALAAQFGGLEDQVVDARSVFALVAELDGLCPGFAEFAEMKVTVAVDGVATMDWSQRLLPESEVLLLPKIAGGML